MQNRSKEEIISLILEAAKSGATRTEIMYKAFLTHNQLDEYLDFLLENQMLEHHKGERIYKTTNEGLVFLKGIEGYCSNPYLSSVSSSQFNKILIVGLGQLGLPVAKDVKERGFDAYGYDISPKAMDRAEKTAAIKKATDFGEFDVYILCVSTHKPEDMFSPQIDGLFSIVERISKEAKNGALVSIESTIPKGTSKKVFEMLNHRLHVAHAPHRWYALEEKEHGVNQLRVVGGVCNCCLKVALQFYDGSSTNNGILSDHSTPASTSSDDNNSNNSSVTHHITSTGDTIDISLPTPTSTSTSSSTTISLGIPMHPVSEVEVAEITKIVENADRYLQISFAEDLYLYCQANNINFGELREALNTKWNVNILEPRDGIGGHCLPKDTRMFLQSSKSIRSKIIQAAMEVDEDYRRYRESRNIQDNKLLLRQ
jgi:UDP-N-acetyl-D-mannosaminuronic acid dehydrogenase